MVSEKIVLNNKSRFLQKTYINEALIDNAVKKATDKLLTNIEWFKHNFTSAETIDFKYESRDNCDWTSGMNTGILYLAYELTGNEAFYDAAKFQLKSYKPRLENKTGLMDHDVGFVYTPSCVADYKVSGNLESRKIALSAAELLLSYFNEKGGFIKRIANDKPSGFRTLVDTMMNLPLLFWAGVETENKEYIEKAIKHYKTTEKYLVRGDGSTFHHFQFNPETVEPERGLTFQGYSDESCWSRGHSWLIYGYPIAYGYTKDESIFDIHRSVTYYFLNKLPSDNIPYWDLMFTEGSKEPRDSSAAAVSVCGLLEMTKYLDDNNSDKEIFKNAADMMMLSLIENCSNDDNSKDGLLSHVTHALPQGRGIDESAIYGDYFYLEALLRYKNSNWKMYW